MSMVASFEIHRITPDIIPVAPSKSMTIVFRNNISVLRGNRLSPSVVKTQPSVTWDPEYDAYYTIIMIDPDVPSRINPVMREALHWLVINIPADEVSKGEVIADFLPSNPTQRSGLHRYIFLLYKQRRKLSGIELIASDQRSCWKASKFAAEHCLGNPVAGNFYQSEYEDSA